MILSSSAVSSKIRVTDSIIKLCWERYLVNRWLSEPLREEFKILSRMGELTLPPASPSLQLSFLSHLEFALSVKILEKCSIESRSSWAAAWRA